MAKDLFGNEIIEDILLRDIFIEPPFSILDSKQGNWRKRVNNWKKIGIKSEVSRENIKTKKGNHVRLLKDIGVKNALYASIFDPALAELLYMWFCPKNGTILDPFAGGSVRGIVANYLGFNYTGIDIRQEQIDSNRDQGLNILDLNNQPQWYVGDSNIILNDFNKQFDFVFSCPPYADLEIYSDLDGDISNKPYKEFLELYESIIKKSCNLLKLVFKKP